MPDDNEPKLNESDPKATSPIIEAVVPRTRSRKKMPLFRLTDRDFEIFRFLYDQKFSSLLTLYLRFFDSRKSPGEPLSEQLPSARQRLGILKRAGLVRTERVYSEAKSLYLLSGKGFKLLQERAPDEIYAGPTRDVDFRNFDHDTRVNLVRAALERSGKSVKWYPERRIRIEGYKIQGIHQELPESIIPDAIFVSSKGERVALEVEATVRQKKRFLSKIRDYESIMGRHDPLIHKVLFVGCADAVGKDLAELLKGRLGFLLERYDYFLESLIPESQGLARPPAKIEKEEESDE